MPGREVPLDRGPAPRGGDDPQLPAGSADAVPHPRQPVRRAHRRGVEPGAVVGDAEAQPAARSLGVGGLHRDQGAARVPVGVLDRLGAAEVDGGLDGRGVPAQALGVDGAREHGPAGRRGKGADEPALAEQRRVDAVCEVAQLAHGGLELRLQPVHDLPRGDGVGVAQPGRPAEVDGERREPLLGAVVQVTLDGASRLHRRDGQPGARLLELAGALAEASHVVAQAHDEDRDEQRHDDAHDDDGARGLLVGRVVAGSRAVPIATRTPDRTMVAHTATDRARGGRWSATMTSGSRSASSPMGVTDGLTQVIASATIQVAADGEPLLPPRCDPAPRAASRRGRGRRRT